MSAKWSLAVLITSVLISYLFYQTYMNLYCIQYFSYKDQILTTTNNNNINKLYDNIPIRTDGVIFISDGSKGYARESAIKLSKHGYHVLVGCKSELEIKSFVYDQRKGLELILFDLTNPSTLVEVIYRLRQIRRDLDRPIVGILINIAEYIEDYSIETPAQYMDVLFIDRYYKALLKGPLRLMQSIFELIKHQQEPIKNLIDNTASMFKNNNHNNNNDNNNITNTNGLRIITLYSSIDSVTIVNSTCGAKCIIQETFLRYLQMIATSENFEYNNFTISKVPIPTQSFYNKDNQHNYNVASYKLEKQYDDYILIRRLKQIDEYKNNKINWLIDKCNSNNKNNNEDIYQSLSEEIDKEYSNKLNKYTKAILHSFLSTSPQKSYS